MIARVRFDGIVREGGKKYALPDHIDIHVSKDGLRTGKKIFMDWIRPGTQVRGIRGGSGVFHPLAPYGEIEFKSVEEREKRQ